jgi:hypothetical protein
MAFVSESGTITSFAEFQDVVDKDTRIFEANEGLSDDVIDKALIRSTEKILARLRNTDWWRSYYIKRNTSTTINTMADIPALDPLKIEARQTDFTDLCVYTALSEIVLPGVADFSNQDSAERQKMAYYEQRASELFTELVIAGDWYDFDNDGTVESSERQPGQINLKRVR